MIRFRSGLFPMMLVAALAGACGGDTVIPLPAKFTAISAGTLHSCGLVGDGAAYCWGYNERGQIGDGSHSDRTTPAPVFGALRFTEVEGGGQHTCGLTSAGKLYCWGLNLSGQLGDGTSADRSTPTAVTGTLTFASVSTGSVSTCATAASGAAFCWGFNERGQLGDGSTTERSSPTAVSGGLTFASLATGAFHTCGVTTAAEIYCWGQNDDGQLGNDAVVDSPTPVKVAASVTFASVDVGHHHSCGVAVDARVFCWGGNAFGQLGLGDTASAAGHITPVEVPGGRLFSSVSTGAVFTCAVEQGTGAGYCWGYNGSGQLGFESEDVCFDESGNDFPCTLDPTAVLGGLSFGSISANTQHVCGLTTDGVAYCWGLGSNGQLGDGSKGDAVFRLEPVRVAGQP